MEDHGLEQFFRDVLENFLRSILSHTGKTFLEQTVKTSHPLKTSMQATVDIFVGTSKGISINLCMDFNEIFCGDF